VLGTLYGGSGGMQAAQAAFNRIYGVPRNEQPNPLRSRVRSFQLLGLLGTGVIVSAGIAIALSTANDISRGLDPFVHALGYLLSFAIAIVLFTGAFELLTARKLHWRQLLRGGLLAAAWWELLQIGAAAFVTHEVKDAGALYGTFAIVLGAILWIYLQAIVLILAAEINVVLQLRLWPRALLTPFTDEVLLTDADRRAYRLYAATERFKGFERVEAYFRDPLPIEEGGGGAETPAVTGPEGKHHKAD
jgi:membrane protein